MDSVPFLFLLAYLIIICLVTQASSQGDALGVFCPSDNFTANSIYSSNRNALLSEFSSLKPNDYGFYNITIGQINQETANGIALCRGDVKDDACISCIKAAVKALPQMCPTQKEAIIYYGTCMFRYSNRSIYAKMETDNSLYVWTNKNASDQESFNKELNALLVSLRKEAATGGPLQKYATGNSSGLVFQTIFALSQCTPDLTDAECDDCLVHNTGLIPECCEGKIGGRVSGPSCDIQFGLSRFYDMVGDPNPTTPPLVLKPPVSATPSPPPSNKTTKVKDATLNWILIAGLILLILILGIVVYCFCKRRKMIQRENATRRNVNKNSNPQNPPMFDFNKIAEATKNFSNENFLGEGGFGPVYKGTLEDGQEIAVKRLSGTSTQGDPEFRNEVVLISEIRHSNLVRILGYSIHGDEKLLIYEYLPNKSLDTILFDTRKRMLLDWPKRFDIMLGIAKGLQYLHYDNNLNVIHRDLKVTNILLNDRYIAKISDFGTARIFETTQEVQNTCRVVGTFGYMAPEYRCHNNYSRKSDVYSYGVILLEIVTGKKITSSYFSGEHRNLVDYVWDLWSKDCILELIDQAFANSVCTSKVKRCVHVGLLCVQDNPNDRPDMPTVIQMVTTELNLPRPKKPSELDFPQPKKPSFAQPNTTSASRNLVTLSELDGR